MYQYIGEFQTGIFFVWNLTHTADRRISAISLDLDTNTKLHPKKIDYMIAFLLFRCFIPDSGFPARIELVEGSHKFFI
jgi:hypothetical protein